VTELPNHHLARETTCVAVAVADGVGADDDVATADVALLVAASVTCSTDLSDFDEVVPNFLSRSATERILRLIVVAQWDCSSGHSVPRAFAAPSFSVTVPLVLRSTYSTTPILVALSSIR
jgi:hypothetical protein